MLLSFVSPARSAAPAQDARPKPPDPVITQRGPHHRVWTRQEVVDRPNDRPRTNVHSYVELGSGMHRWDAQARAWVDAEAVIEIAGHTAVAGKGAHQVTFAANANTAGCIDLVTPDGKRLRSHLLGIAWYDAKSGRTELIGELKDSLGELHQPNVVIYPDAFDGLKADLRYTYRLGSFEQDVILRERPELPDGYAPDTTRLEVWTEFIEAPAATLTQRGRVGMTDDTLNFGSMQTGAGKAFALGDEAASGYGALVSKRWFTAEGRTFLVEAVRYSAAKRNLDKLPAQGQAQAAPRRQWPAHPAGRPFPDAPAPRQARANQPAEKFRMASTPSPLGGERAGVRGAAADFQSPNRKSEIVNNRSLSGFVLDYTLYASLTNFTFQGDTTYYVSNSVSFFGTSVVEGSTVVKFAKTNTAQLNFNSTITWLTAQYRPAIFTAKDDNTVGETMAGSSGTPTGYYGGEYLAGLTAEMADPLEGVRISYAQTGMRFTGTSSAGKVRHSQFLHCTTAIAEDTDALSSGLYLENLLFYDVSTVRDGTAQITGAHLTVHNCATFSSGDDSRPVVIYNSLFVGTGGLELEWGNVSPTLNSCYDGGDTGIFLTVGAGAHYLAAGSPYRNAGSTSISAGLLADLKRRTTCPPIVLSNLYITNQDLTLTPQALRDIDSPDLGYHYDPLDFVAVGHYATNATITLQPGTALGLCATSVNYSISLAFGARLVSVGSPTNLNRIVRYNAVQEQANTNWAGFHPGLLIGSFGGPTSTEMRFTEWVIPGTANLQQIYGYCGAAALVASDCQFHGGNFEFFNTVAAATNCLFNRSAVIFSEQECYDLALDPKIHHSTFKGGSLHLWDEFGTGWSFQNNLFAGTSISTNGYANFSADYNGYTTNTTRLNTSATHDVTNLVFNFDTGPLGYFYLPTDGPATNLFNVGSTNANLLGLWHFSCTTNQWKETNSIVDIGFHYIAVGTNGLPVDTDGDGVPDYLEDANGNGSLDHRETKVNDAADRGLRVFITRPKSGSTIP